MTTLTADQMAFLESQRIQPWRVFDATGLTQSEYRAVMRELGLSIASGVTPCAAHGHTLRTRAGHCVQCNTARIAFMRRHDEPAYVYVAQSSAIGLVKVGVAGDVNARLQSLRKLGYGGASDWRLVSSRWCEHAGAAEFALHATLSGFQAHRVYQRDGFDVDCRELFRCPAEHVAAMLASMSAA